MSMPQRRFELERLMLFSDAVFAIAITLSAVSLPTPDPTPNVTDQQLIQSLFGDQDIVMAYLIGFAVIGLFWLGHHRVFSVVIQWDRGLIVWNLVFLFLIALLPWPTRVMARFGQLPAATIIYAAFVAATGFALLAIWRHAWRNGLMIPGLDPRLHRFSTVRGAVVPAYFLVTMPLALIDPDIAQLSWLGLIPLEWGFTMWARSAGIVRSDSQAELKRLVDDAQARLAEEEQAEA